MEMQLKTKILEIDYGDVYALQTVSLPKTFDYTDSNVIWNLLNTRDHPKMGVTSLIKKSA